MSNVYQDHTQGFERGLHSAWEEISTGNIIPTQQCDNKTEDDVNDHTHTETAARIEIHH